jgi:uncharacterized protein YgiM (DUF1202 family)
MKKRLIAFMLALVLCLSYAGTDGAIVSNAKGAEYYQLVDVYYTKDNCMVYAEPTYNSTILTTIGANIPVQVLGYYSNGWYRISIGVICYVKMDSLTTTGVLGTNVNDTMTADALKTASEIGYTFVPLSLNKEKVIKKDVFNSYIGQKVILYAKIDDDFGVMFKMLYNDKVTSDIDLNYTITDAIGPTNERIVYYNLENPTELKGQIAIFQFKLGYDKAITIFPSDMDNGGFVEMNTYYTEYSELAYAPMTQVASIMVTDEEVPFSLTDNMRKVNSDHRKGIKYLSDDKKDYRDSITSKVRKDTEYVDYVYQ